MTTDPFTEAARAEAERRVMGDSRFAHTTRDLLVGMAEWARDHLVAQEPTDAEVEAAADVLEIIDGMDFRDVARAALSAARAARRDEEKR